MMTFAHTWERQERVRHQLLLQQLKSELATKSERITTDRFRPSTSLPANRLISRPKLNKVAQPQDLIQVATR